MPLALVSINLTQQLLTMLELQRPSLLAVRALAAPAGEPPTSRRRRRRPRTLVHQQGAPPPTWGDDEGDSPMGTAGWAADALAQSTGVRAFFELHAASLSALGACWVEREAGFGDTEALLGLVERSLRQRLLQRPRTQAAAAAAAVAAATHKLRPTPTPTPAISTADAAATARDEDGVEHAPPAGALDSAAAAAEGGGGPPVQPGGGQPVVGPPPTEGVSVEALQAWAGAAEQWCRTVSHSCACIGSLCLRNCVHGASIGHGAAAPPRRPAAQVGPVRHARAGRLAAGARGGLGLPRGRVVVGDGGGGAPPPGGAARYE
jgi:hypothetical protein